MLCDTMKMRIGIVILILAALGLGIGLIGVKKQAEQQQTKDNETILSFSNRLAETNGKLQEQKDVTTMLEKDLDTQKKSMAELTNSITQVSANLAQTEATLKASQAEVTKLNTKISDLETQNQALDKTALELSTSITNLTMEIADTQRKLSTSEGNKAFLEKELKRLMAEKGELERQFNDLNVVRAQFARLKEEFVIARRVEWTRQGIYAAADQKGAQKLMHNLNAPATRAAKPNYDLNVEVNSDGSVRVVPPSTNAPAPPK